MKTKARINGNGRNPRRRLEKTLHGPHPGHSELELELIQTQMAQKPMLRAEVYAHAMRASQNRKKEVRREKEV